jgi:hypothetical protein
MRCKLLNQSSLQFVLGEDIADFRIEPRGGQREP